MKSLTKKIPAELATGLVFLVIGIIILLQILKIKSPESAMLDYFSIGIYLAMATLITASGVIGKNKDRRMDFFFYRPKELILLLSLALLYHLMKLCSFYYLVFPFAFTTNLITTEDLSKKNLIVSAIFAAVLSLVIYVLCRIGLGMVL